MKEELIIYQKYVDLIDYAYVLLIKYPKYEKFGICSEIRKNMFSTLQNILLISHEFDGSTKLKLLNELDALVGMHKFYIRFSYNKKYINSSNYMEWSKRINEIGKMIGGWYKYYAKAKK
jgi:hypothetical protein